MALPLARTAFIGLMALSTTTSPSYSATKDDPSFHLVNRGAAPITELYATPAGRKNWGQNRLGSTPVPPGASRTVRIAKTGDCYFDLRVVFAGGKSLTQRHADLCKITDVPVP